MIKFSEIIKNKPTQWKFSTSLKIEGMLQCSDEKEAKKVFDSFLNSLKEIKGNVSIKENSLVIASENISEGFDSAQYRDSFLGIARFDYTTGGMDFWKMQSSPDGNPMTVVVQQTYNLDKNNSYVLRVVPGEQYATPVDLDKCKWIF